MRNPRRVRYQGRDLLAFQELIAALEPAGLQVLWGLDPDAPLCEDDSLADWYQVIVLDADLETLVGLDEHRHVAQIYPGVPVIVLCERRARFLAVHGLARLAGAEALLFKPSFNPDQLRAIVTAAFTRLDRWRNAFTHAPPRPQLVAQSRSFPTGSSTADPSGCDASTQAELVARDSLRELDALIAQL